jgi:thiol-disulfide isomerase/thioredoxin
MAGSSLSSSNSSLYCWLFALTLLACSVVPARAQSSFPYIYASRTNHNASFPVIEYFAPTGKKQLDNDKPAFLYSEKEGYRIVVFYGHWCNTCKNFKPHYVHFAQRVQQLAKQHNETVAVYAVSCHPNRKLCRKQTTLGYPIVRLLPPKATEGIDVKHTDINPLKCLQQMGMKFDSKELEIDWDMPEPVASSQSSLFDFILGRQPEKAVVVTTRRRTREEMKNDIHLSFDFAMRDGVFSSDEPLSEKAAKALKDWLKLLQKTLPPTWEIQAVLEQLIRDHSYITKHEAYMYGILDQFTPPSPVWSLACSKGDPDAGYTCGLWELFHAMTVGVVEYNTLNHELKRISPDDAAHTLRDYIEHFFKCTECRNNFLTMYDSCAHDRCTRLESDAKGVVSEKQTSWAQLALWLFEAHNGVNVRLVKERAERDKRTATKQDELDALWPSKRECLACYSQSNKDDEVQWNKTNVFKWLLLEYGQRDASSAELMRDLQALGLHATKEAKRKQSKFQIANGSVLMVLCVVFALGAKVQRRHMTGRHKKLEHSAFNKSSKTVELGDALQRSPTKKRGVLSSVGILSRGNRKV